MLWAVSMLLSGNSGTTSTGIRFERMVNAWNLKGFRVDKFLSENSGIFSELWIFPSVKGGYYALAVAKEAVFVDIPSQDEDNAYWSVKNSDSKEKIESPLKLINRFKVEISKTINEPIEIFAVFPSTTEFSQNVYSKTIFSAPDFFKKYHRNISTDKDDLKSLEKKLSKKIGKGKRYSETSKIERILKACLLLLFAFCWAFVFWDINSLILFISEQIEIYTGLSGNSVKDSLPF